MNSSTEKALILIMAMCLALLPAYSDVVYDVDPLSDVDPCGTFPEDICEGSACSGEPDHGDDNCCEAGCQNCSLPCCSGTSMIATVSQGLDSALTANGSLAADASEMTWVDADPPFRPPRS